MHWPLHLPHFVNLIIFSEDYKVCTFSSHNILHPLAVSFLVDTVILLNISFQHPQYLVDFILRKAPSLQPLRSISLVMWIVRALEWLAPWLLRGMLCLRFSARRLVSTQYMVSRHLNTFWGGMSLAYLTPWLILNSEEKLKGFLVNFVVAVGRIWFWSVL